MNADVEIVAAGEFIGLTLNLAAVSGHRWEPSLKELGLRALTIHFGGQELTLEGWLAEAIGDLLRGLSGTRCGWHETQDRGGELPKFYETVELSPALERMLKAAVSE